MSNVPISSVVSVTISRQTQGVTQAGFGTPLILTDEDSGWGGELVREYADIDEVLTDFASSTDAYKAAAAAFAQSPSIEALKIGAEGTRTAQVMTMVFSADIVTGNTISSFTISFGGQTETVTSTAFNTSNSQTLTDLATKIQATSAIATATSDGSHTITITSAKAGVGFSITTPTVTGGATQATVVNTTTVQNSGVAEFLADISEEDDDWYGLIWANERDQDHMVTAAAYIETKRKIFITCSDDTDILSDVVTTDLATILSGANYERTAVIYNADVADFADAAWMGKLFPYDPGSETWKFKTLSGITADTLTSSQRTAAQDKNCNIYVTIGGVSITEEGVMASGEFIDVMRGVDWLQARLEERIYSRLVNLPKIPFTEGGVAIIEAEIRAVLENAIRDQILSPDPLDPDSDDRELSTMPYIISAPRVVDISANDRAERLLPDVTFQARLAGAIHRVTIQGTVTV